LHLKSAARDHEMATQPRPTKMRSMEVDMELQTLMERLSMALLAGAASITWLLVLVFIPLALSS
jgi:hypothetical protein